MFEQLIDSFSLSSALSGCIGVAATLLATHLRQITEQRKRREALKRILKTELECVRDTYVMPQKEIDRETVSRNASSVALTQNYTTIYDTNAESLGMLGRETASSVVRAYTLLKALIDLSASYVKLYDTCLYEKARDLYDKSYHTDLLQRLYPELEHAKEEAFAAIKEAIRLLS